MEEEEEKQKKKRRRRRMTKTKEEEEEKKIKKKAIMIHEWIVYLCKRPADNGLTSLPIGQSATLSSHMHRKLKLTSSPTCPCGQEDQTTEHVLQSCPLHKATREDVWPVSTSLTTKLCCCTQELEKTTSFLSRAALIV